MNTKILLLPLLWAGTFCATAQTDVTFGEINTLGTYTSTDISAECRGIYSLRMDDGDDANREEASSVWCTSHTLDLSRSFEMEFDIRFGDISEADGMTFTMQNESNTALEGGGGWLGVTNDWSGADAITDAVTVEFDIFDNGDANGDRDEDHCAISYNGVLDSPVVGPNAITLTNNAWEHVNINWDACDTTLTVILNGERVAVLESDLVNNVFGGISTGIFFGFTSASWSRNTTHDLCFHSYRSFECCENIDPPKVELFSPILCDVSGCCIGVSVGHDSDANVSVIYDWGDGTTSYENIHNYASSGTYEITVIANYHLLGDPMNCCIKTTTARVRLDCGRPDVFDEKKIQETPGGNQKNRAEIFPNPVTNGEELTLQLEEAPVNPVHFSIVNMSGQKVLDFQSNGSSTIRVALPTEMSDGLYMIVSDNKAIEPVKFQIKR